MGAALIRAPSYRDPRKAIDFLVEAFGFEGHAIYEAEDGTISHAELTLGGSMVIYPTALTDK